MNICPKCKSKKIGGVEYGYPSPERYDGISEWECLDCYYRQGRWTGKELLEGYCEPRFGRGGEPVRVHEREDEDFKSQ